VDALPRDRAGHLKPRRATRADLDALTRFWLALTEHHARRNPLYALRAGAEAEARRLVAAQLSDPDAAFFVCSAAAAPEALAGFCAVRVDVAPPIHVETRRAEITDLWVEPAARRGGSGRCLVGAAFEWVQARGLEQIEVRVASDNPEGQGFWRALGFADLMDVLHQRL
jgi:ribosomal protein S18 acetylase RimI-like enzyme